MNMPKNVLEQWSLYDTVILRHIAGATVPQAPAGWFTGANPWGDCGAANDIAFFNVRNRNIGLPYNNQDARDQMPYPMKIRSIGVAMWQVHQTLDMNFQPASPYDDICPHIWMVDLPRHCSLVLKVQQDERFKTIVPLCPPGYGPCGDGYGRGQPSAAVGPSNTPKDNHYSLVTQGIPDSNTRWTFPTDIDVPRRASISVKLRFSEYARNLLTWMGSLNADVFDADGDIHSWEAGIQVTLGGDRLVQQRGQYHA